MRCYTQNRLSQSLGSSKKLKINPRDGLAVEEWKTMTVLLFYLKTYEDHGFWKIEEWKTMTVLLFLVENL